MKRTSRLVAGVAALAVLGGAGLVFTLGPWRGGGEGTGDGGSPAVVRIGSLSMGIDYAPYLYAKEKGWFENALKDDGVTVEYTTFQSLPPVNESFASGRIDVVFEAEIPAIVGRAAGADLRIEAMLSAVKAEDVAVPESSKASSIADLKGKKLAVMAGSGYHYALLSSIERNGLARGDFTIVDMAPPDAKAAFETGAVDGWACWPHWPEQEVVSGKGRLIKALNDRVQVVTVVRGDFAKQNPKQLAKILAVLERAKQWVQQNPSEAQQMVSKALDLSPKVVELCWPKEVWDAQLSPEVAADIQSKANFLKAEGIIKGSLDVKRDLIRKLGEVPAEKAAWAPGSRDRHLVWKVSRSHAVRGASALIAPGSSRTLVAAR